jgi:hypothetical protein
LAVSRRHQNSLPTTDQRSSRIQKLGYRKCLCAKQKSNAR